MQGLQIPRLLANSSTGKKQSIICQSDPRKRIEAAPNPDRMNPEAAWKQDPNQAGSSEVEWEEQLC